MICVLIRIMQELKTRRNIQCQFDTDETTLYVADYFKRSGYKVKVIDASTVRISKRWYQK